jgi:hypothetical protein
MVSDNRAGSMAEAAVSMPVVLLILALALSVSSAGHAAITARNAADYGARLGAVAGTNARMYAESAARLSLAQSDVGANFPVEAVLIGDGQWSLVSVTVDWSSPTIFAGICPLFGGGCPSDFHGVAQAVWRREGWRQ